MKKKQTKKKNTFFYLAMSIVVHLDTDATDTLWRPNNKNEITFRSVANLQRLSPF
jgi:hypothetical protein